jgi:predicted secreted protein
METITLKPGQEHRITIPGLGSAGYRWIAEPYDQNVVIVEEILHSRQEVTVPIAGSLQQIFKLIAVAPGHTSVIFNQRRRFEPEKKPHVSYEISVAVTS